MKRTLALFLIVAMLATTALFLCSCGAISNLTEDLKSDLVFELNSDGESYACLGFKDGKSAAEVVIPETYKGLPVTRISDYAFNEDPLIDFYEDMYGYHLGNEQEEEEIPLTSVTIPDSVVEIGEAAFLSCKELKTYNLPKNIQKIGLQAFAKSGISGELVIPDTVTKIGAEAFAKTGITSVTLSKGITVIPQGLFFECFDLVNVTLHDDVTEIGEKAFYGCEAMTSFTFPASLTTINNQAFGKCTGLREMTIRTTVTTLGELIFTETSEELVVNVSYDSERPENWNYNAFAGMPGKAINVSEAFYQNVVLVDQAREGELQNEINACTNEILEINDRINNINKIIQDLRQYAGDYSDVADQIKGYKSEIEVLTEQRSKIADEKDQLLAEREELCLSTQIN